MKLKLRRPLAFFDLETTGTDVAKDRIVEIYIRKVFPNGTHEGKSWLVNPSIKIPKEASDIHGITDEQVSGEPTFNELAQKISDMIQGCDLAGFNSNRFDIPLLAEEMLRAGIDIDIKSRWRVDVQTIFHKKEKRTLSAGYKFYCGKDLTDAHTAEADTKATLDILLAQIEWYDDLGDTVEELAEFSEGDKSVDLAGYFVMNDKEQEIFNFGKYKGRVVIDVLRENTGYYNWFQRTDFPLYSKRVFTEIKLKYEDD